MSDNGKPKTQVEPEEYLQGLASKYSKSEVDPNPGTGSWRFKGGTHHAHISAPFLRMH